MGPQVLISVVQKTINEMFSTLWELILTSFVAQTVPHRRSMHVREWFSFVAFQMYVYNLTSSRSKSKHHAFVTSVTAR
jgi:hypothetical protein